MDPVNHPDHYNRNPSGVECIEIVRWLNFNVGNAMKYIWRGGFKISDPREDYRKAIWYLQDEITRISSELGEER